MIFLLAAPLGSAFYADRLIDFYRRTGAVKLNYRGKAVPPALGPALFLGYLPGAAAAFWIDRSTLLFPVLFLWTGFAFLGLWDDHITERTSGFKGHFGAALQGKLTAGFLKMALAAIVGFIFSGSLPGSPGDRLAALLLLLLSANGLNLFDRRPGRALKIFFIGALLIIFLARFPGEAARLLLPFLVGTLAIATLDLEAEAMLGDCGANLLGAVLGAGAVLTLSRGLQAVFLIFWLMINLFSEYFSISRVVEKNSWLRFLDYLGRFREKPI